MSLTTLTMCKHCLFDGTISRDCFRCVNGSKFKAKAVLDKGDRPTTDDLVDHINKIVDDMKKTPKILEKLFEKGDEWDTYCRNDVENTRKMIMATTNPYREKETRDALDHFVYMYKLDEELKEKENMYVNTKLNNEIKVTYKGRECIVNSAEFEEYGNPYDMPRIRLDCVMTRSAIPHNEYSKNKKAEAKIPTIKNVIFNPPATVVIWSDDTKTVVKAENEDFDPEKGLAMAITKKVLGNKGNYFETIKKYVKPYEKKHPKPTINAGLKPATFEFTLADVDISKLGDLVGTTKDGMKVYFGNHEKLDGEA